MIRVNEASGPLIADAAAHTLLSWSVESPVGPVPSEYQCLRGACFVMPMFSNL